MLPRDGALVPGSSRVVEVETSTVKTVVVAVEVR
jgi:hypothetical protein